MKLIELRNGEYAKVDDQDYDLVAAVHWHQTEYGYAKCGKVFMHHLILRPTLGMVVDHKNGETLDNQRSNLRLATRAENGQNRKLNVNSRSGYKGVSWEEAKGRWRVTIAINKRRKHLGYVDQPLEGAVLYNQVAIELHGKFARLNDVSSRTFVHS